MRVLTGDETGILKLVDVNKKSVVAKWGTQQRENGVARMAWLPAGADDAELSSARVAVLTKTGAVNVWDTATGAVQHTATGAGADGALLLPHRGRFITCAADGTVRVFSQAAKAAEGGKGSSKFSVKPSIATARLHAGAGLLAVGGREHDLALWDVATGKPVFEARNVAQTTLALRVPVWVAGVAFLPEPGAAAALGGGSDAPSSSSGFVIATVTGHKHVRIYDTRAGDRRPVRSVDMGDHAFTALELAPDGRSVLTGDAAGVLRRIDLGTLKQVGGYKGVGGAVKALAVRAGGSASLSSSASQQPLLASVGLDRALRVHHIASRKLLRRVHLKQRLTAVLFAPEAAPAVGAEDGDDAEVEEELLPEPPPDGRIRITQRRVEADATRARDEKDVGDGSGAAAEEDADEVWRELDRRAALAKASGGSSAAAPATAAGGAKRARPAAAAAAAASAADDEEDGSDDDDEDEEDEEDDDIDDRINGDNDGGLAGEGDSDGEDEEGDDDDDDSALSGFTDEEDEDGEGAAGGGGDSDDEDDDDDDGSGDDDDDDDDSSSDGPNSEDEAAALVDSRDAARSALRQTKLARIAKAKGRAPPAIAMGGPHQKKGGGKPQGGGGGGGKGRGAPPAKQARR